MMLQTTNFNQANVCALYNKGVSRAIALDSLTSKNEKKMANYLVVPNICILSLSLSLSSRAGVNNTFFLLAYAREKRAVNPVNKGLLEVSFVLFCIILVRSIEREISQSLFDFKYLKSLISWQKNTPTGYMSSFWNR